MGTVESMSGTVASHAGSPVNVVRGQGMTLSWGRGQFYSSDAHPFLTKFARPSDSAPQLGILSRDQR